MATGFCWHELFAWHDAGPQIGAFVEPIGAQDTPESKRRFRNLVDASGLLADLVEIVARPATDAEILRVHCPDHFARIVQIDETGGTLGRMAHIGAGGLKIVRLAAGAAIETVNAVIDGRVANAYALVRPCGHHADRDKSFGLSILNNIAIAAKHAIEVKGLRRIAIVDWDVHWGNGTQAIFWTDPRVLAISLHQNELLTMRGGYAHEIGEGAGTGTTVNIPLPPGSGHGAYVAAFERVVVPALERYKPDMILVASGLDALSSDPYGRMNLHSGTYRVLTTMLLEAANRLCNGRLMLCHEGGYNPVVVPFAGLAIMETLSGIATDVADPFQVYTETQADQALADHQARAIAAAEKALRLVPPN